MSEKSDQLKKLIEAVVRKEVRAIVPQIVKEVMAGMIMEAHVPNNVQSAAPYSNSDKRRSLMETAPGYNISSMVEWDGDDAPTPSGGFRPRNNSHGLNLPSGQFIGGSESPQPVPIDPSQVPDAVVRAMNTDYRPLMEMLKKRGQGLG